MALPLSIFYAICQNTRKNRWMETKKTIKQPFFHCFYLPMSSHISIGQWKDVFVIIVNNIFFFAKKAPYTPQSRSTDKNQGLAEMCDGFMWLHIDEALHWIVWISQYWGFSHMLKEETKLDCNFCSLFLLWLFSLASWESLWALLFISIPLSGNFFFTFKLVTLMLYVFIILYSYFVYSVVIIANYCH